MHSAPSVFLLCSIICSFSSIMIINTFVSDFMDLLQEQTLPAPFSLMVCRLWSRLHQWKSLPRNQTLLRWRLADRWTWLESVQTSLPSDLHCQRWLHHWSHSMRKKPNIFCHKLVFFWAYLVLSTIGISLGIFCIDVLWSSQRLEEKD